MKRVCAVVLLSFGLATSAAAQRTTGEIIGKVIDESGSVLPGVTVTLRGAGVAGAPTVGDLRDRHLPVSGAAAGHLRARVRARRLHDAQARRRFRSRSARPSSSNVDAEGRRARGDDHGRGRGAGRQRRRPSRGQHHLQPRVGARTRRSSASPTSTWSTRRRASAPPRTSARARRRSRSAAAPTRTRTRSTAPTSARRRG